MILILIFAEALGLYGLIVALILSQWDIKLVFLQIFNKRMSNFKKQKILNINSFILLTEFNCFLVI